MVLRRQVLSVAALSVALVMGACGSDDTAATPPNAQELASSLITADDYEGEWKLNVPADAPEAASGVVPDELQTSLPGLELCDAASAESRAAVESLRWKAFRQLDLTSADPIEPPDDRSGHLIFVQEFLTSAEPAQIETTFKLLRDGMQACLGDLPAGEEGPGTAEAMAVPEVGDDRYGVLTLLEEAGGWAQWRLHHALVRRGPVLVLLGVVEIRAGEGVEPLYSIDDVATMVQTAVAKL